MHGGKSPGAREKAAANMERANAEQAVRRLNLTVVDIDPREALLDELRRCYAVVRFLDAQVAAEDLDDVVWGRTREKVGGDDRGTTHEAGLSVWVRWWQDERDRLVVVSRECVKANIDERRMELAERYGDGLASVVRAILGRLELSEGQRVLVATVVPEELRRMAELTGPAGASPGVTS